MEAPKKASKTVLGAGGAVGIGTVLLLIGWKVNPVQAQLDKLEVRTDRRMERFEAKQDAMLMLQLGESQEKVRALLDKLKSQEKERGAHDSD